MRLKLLLAATLLSLFSTSVLAQLEPYEDYTMSEELWDITMIKVDPNMGDDYLEGLRDTWVAANRVALARRAMPARKAMPARRVPPRTVAARRVADCSESEALTRRATAARKMAARGTAAKRTVATRRSAARNTPMTSR